MKTATCWLTLIALLLAFVLLEASFTSLAQDDTAIGIDASSQGNAATSLGVIDSCVSVAKGQTFDVDVFVENVTDLLAWEAYLTYDHAIVKVIDRDVDMFQAAGPGGSVLNVSDSVPFDADRPFRIGATEMAEPPVGNSGSGVLARLTLSALAQGDTLLSIEPVDLNKDAQLKYEDDIGPYLKDSKANVIGDADGNTFFDGPIGAAKVVVDGDCETSASETAPADDGGWRWWMTAVIIGAAVVVVAASGYLVQRARRRSAK